MAEKSSLRLRIDPEDWLDADLPTVLVAEPDVALLDVDLPVVRVAAWDSVEVDADSADRQLAPRRDGPPTAARRHLGPHPGEDSTI